MRALVTGVAGFIGSTLAERLLSEGADLVGIDSFTDYYPRQVKERNVAGLLAQKRFRFVESRIQDADLSALLADRSHVFHLAAQAGVRKSWGKDFAVYTTNNIEATQVLLEAACARPQLERFVYASSSSVYGDNVAIPMREDALPQPVSPYGVSKLAAEQLCYLYFVNYRVPTVSLRYFTVFGPRQRPDMSIQRLCEAVVRGGAFPRYGDGTQVREFTYVDDIVGANLAAAAADVAPGTYVNVAGGGEITLNDLIALVGELAGTPVPVEPKDAQAGDAIRNGGAIDRARELLGWEPHTSLRDGVAAQLAWNRSRVELAS